MPAAVQDEAVAALRRLLHVENEIRHCASIEELNVLLVNELKRMTGARQAYAANISRQHVKILKASGSGVIDAHAPTVQWLQKEIARHFAHGAGKAEAIALQTGAGASSEEGRTYPFPHLHWFPVYDAGPAGQGGILIASETVFAEGAVTLAQRVAGTAGHAARVLVNRAPRRHYSFNMKLLMGGALIAVLCAMALPVPMTALAPMEVAAKDAFIIAAPIDGVIDDILVPPNAQVKSGDVLVRYVDTVTRNQLQLAERELTVAETKLRQLQQLSFVDERAKRDLAQARSEVALKLAERDFAKDTADKSVILAPREGVVIYGDKKEWVGKPVSTGQRILELADLSNVELRAQLPVAEVLDLKPGARVRAFLDGDPLRPLEATLVFMSHQAKNIEGIGLSYRVQAQFDASQKLPRPGVRGTAQLYADKAPLAFYLFRRPLVWARQKIGM